ncbi:MAG: hypothetical protein KH050_00205 [Clostridiaceae bacterium]|nr:hypothetical protein [Clostridiaceae bacterium]
MTTKIYEPLKLFFYASLINLILILIPSADNAFFDLLISFVGIAAGIISLYALYRMRDISSHLRGAFNFSVLSIIGMLVSLLFTVISTFNADSGFAIGMILFFSILALVFALFSVIANYHFYWGLDELIETNGYHYPLGRIKWCFYISIISTVVVLFVEFAAGSGWLTQFLSFAASGVQLYLFYGYLQAVRTREEQTPLM